MKLEKHVNLHPYNTFAIKAYAHLWARLDRVDDLLNLKPVFQNGLPIMVLGGGSNVLFVENFSGLILKNEIKGISIVKETEKEIELKVGAGENWHQLVCTCVQKKWYGIENLTLIPGTTGAAPIQNIGAYGVELQEVFTGLDAFDLQDLTLHKFSPQDCAFGYRDSIFKYKYPGRFLITHIQIKLSKTAHFNLSYTALGNLFADGREVTIQAVSDAVAAIRRAKLPDPNEIPNAGSFFKNPLVTKSHYETLKQMHTDVPYYHVSDSHCKIPAAWLIEQGGFKGKRLANAGVHDKQALVLINHNQAEGREILELAAMIKQQIHEKFGVELEYEVNIVGPKGIEVRK